MFAPKMNTYVDSEIHRTVTAMKDLAIDSKEYATTVEQLSKLQKIRQEEKPDTLSADVALQAVASLIGIALIIRHEELNVITTKALSFIKLR